MYLLDEGSIFDWVGKKNSTRTKIFVTSVYMYKVYLPKLACSLL